MITPLMYQGVKWLNWKIAVKDSWFRSHHYYAVSKEQSRTWVHINFDSEDMDQLNLIECKIQPAIAIDWTGMIVLQMSSALTYKIASNGCTVGE